MTGDTITIQYNDGAVLTLALSSSVSSSLTCFKTHALTCFTTCALTCFKTCVLTCFKTCACVFTCFHVFPCICWFLVRPNLNLIGGDMGPWLANVVVPFNIYHLSSASFHTRAHAACMHAHMRASTCLRLFFLRVFVLRCFHPPADDHPFAFYYVVQLGHKTQV